VLADERDHLAGPVQLGRGESRRRLENLTLAWRSPAFSRFSRLISACSADVVPGRWPASISARRTYLRSVSAVPMPSFLATAQIAAYCEG
jgi:hypothetical protein